MLSCCIVSHINTGRCSHPVAPSIYIGHKNYANKGATMQQERILYTTDHYTESQAPDDTPQPRFSIKELLDSYDPNGSDLYIEPYQYRYDYAMSYYLHGKNQGGEEGEGLLEQAASIFMQLNAESKGRERELSELLDEIRDENLPAAQYVQDRTLAEITRLAGERGYEHDMYDEEAYIETVKVLQRLEHEFKKTARDDVMIALVQVWQSELQTKLATSQTEKMIRASTGRPAFIDLAA